MQRLGQNGYTDDEVEDELRFKRGRNTMGFRYELLDNTNTLKRAMTNVLSCSVRQDYSADIKRSATVTILDDSTINYLSDRIKPWVRLELPQDSRTYNQIISQYAAAITGAYEMDETSGTAATDSSPGGSHPGVYGANVVLGSPGIASGSSCGFVGGTTAPYVLSIVNGADFFHSPAGSPAVNNSFSLSLWIQGGTDLSNEVVLEIAGGSGTTVGMGFDFAGKFWFAFSAADGSWNKVDCNNPSGKNLKHILVTWSLGSPTKVYLDGQLAPNQNFTGNQYSLPAPSAANPLNIGYAFTGLIDSLVFFNIPISGDRARDIYRSGAKVGPFGTSNYAEWPQGVYLISSPTRSLDAAGVVTRSIECFDQLEILTDDLAQARFVAQKGALYMNCILGLALSYQSAKLPIYGASWTRVSANASSPVAPFPEYDSFSITGPTTSGARGFYSSTTYTCANLDMRSFIPSSITWGASGVRGYRMRFYIDANNYAEIVCSSANVGNTSFTTTSKLVQGGSVIGTGSVTHVNPYPEKFMRITEYNGYLIFQTSQSATPTASNFVTIQTSAALPYLSKGQLIVEAFTTTTESAWSVTASAGSGVTISAAPWKYVNATPSTAFLNTSKDYEPGTSKLSIINELLDAINYDHIFFDENGILTLRPYMSPSVMPEEFVYADNFEGVTLPGNMTQTLDLFKVPNTWVAIATNPDTASSFSNVPGYPKVNKNATSPTSTVNRGRTITKVITDMSDTPDLVTLLANIDKIAEQDSQVYEVVTMQTAIIPIHGDRNILRIQNSPLGINDKFEEIGWSFDFVQGAAMSHSIRKYVDVS